MLGIINGECSSMQIHVEYRVSYSPGIANFCNKWRRSNRWKVVNSPYSFHFKVQYKSGQVLHFTAEIQSWMQHLPLSSKQLWRQTEQPLNSIEKNNQNNTGHMRLKSGLRECLRGVFLFRKWTPQCVTFPTNLLSHTQVLKLRKLFPAYHILPQWKKQWHAS